MIFLLKSNSKDLLIANLKEELGKVKDNRSKVEILKEKLGEFGVLPGRVQNVINNTDALNKMSLGELYVYALSFSDALKIGKLNVANYFTSREIKELGSKEITTEEALNFPITFKNVLKVNDSYYFAVDVTTLRLLDQGKEIQYNPNTQRDVSYAKSQDDDTLIPVPKLNKKSVSAIRSLFRSGELIDSTLIFNARLGTSDEGEEIIYDEDTAELTITKGTMFDCLDGYHRFVAVTTEQAENPDLNMDLMVKVINASEKEAKKHFTQTNTINPIPKSHRLKMNEDDLASFIINRINKESEIKNKIASSSNLNNTLTTYQLMAEGISKGFKVKNRAEAIAISNFLIELVDNFSYSHPEVLEDFDKQAPNLVFKGFFWRGLMILAGKAKEDDLSPMDIVKLLDSIDFTYKNPLWEDLKVVVEGKLSSYSKNALEKYLVSLVEGDS